MPLPNNCPEVLVVAHAVLPSSKKMFEIYDFSALITPNFSPRRSFVLIVVDTRFPGAARAKHHSWIAWTALARGTFGHNANGRRGSSEFDLRGKRKKSLLLTCYGLSIGMSLLLPEADSV